jgi:hypothetical protein
MQHEAAMPCQHVSPILFSPKEFFLPHIGGIRIVGGKSHTTPRLALMIRLTKHGYRTYGRAQ